MRWFLFRKLEYYPFDHMLVDLGYVSGHSRVSSWHFKNVFSYIDGNLCYSLRGWSDIRRLKKFLQRQVNQAYVTRVGQEIRVAADVLLAITKRAFHDKKSLRANLTAFCRAHGRLLTVFQMPELAWYFTQGKDKKLLARFGMDRDYAARQIVKVEAIYRRQLGKIVGLPARPALYMLPGEVETFLQNNTYPVGLKRRRSCVLLFVNGKPRIFWNRKADLFFKKEYGPYQKRQQQQRQLTGQVAYPGLVRGRVYRALREHDFKKIPKGAILVCSMTRYNVAPYLKNLRAIITDQGGITCHAAVISRELKVPTVIGAWGATEAFHTGDLIEVDAEKGVVKLIKKAG